LESRRREAEAQRQRLEQERKRAELAEREGAEQRLDEIERPPQVTPSLPEESAAYEQFADPVQFTTLRPTRIYVRPETSADVLARLPDGNALSGIGVRGEWLKIQSRTDQVGWVQLVDVQPDPTRAGFCQRNPFAPQCLRGP
jgi:hypothetical protein